MDSYDQFAAPPALPTCRFYRLEHRLDPDSPFAFRLQQRAVRLFHDGTHAVVVDWRAPPAWPPARRGRTQPTPPSGGRPLTDHERLAKHRHSKAAAKALGAQRYQR